MFGITRIMEAPPPLPVHRRRRTSFVSRVMTFVAMDLYSIVIVHRISEGVSSERNMDFHCEGNDTYCEDILTELEKEISMAYLLCKEMSSLFMALTEMTVTRILGIIIFSDEGLQDHRYASSTFFSARGSRSQSDALSLNSRNADVLIPPIEEAPGINWTIVMDNLDHEGLYIHHEAAAQKQSGVHAESSSGLGCYGINAIAHPQDLEYMDPSSPKLLSASEIYQVMSG